MDANSIPLNRLYDDLEHLWPLVSQPGEYAEEAGYWRQVLREMLGQGRHHVLELGVGGGHNLSHLTPDFDATAVDLSPQMIAHSRALNPTVEHFIGDMRTVRLGQKFSAVLIHDAIDYMLSEDDLRAAFTTAAAHLRPGGVFITTPDHFRDSFHAPYVDCRTHALGETQLTYVEYTYDPDPSDTAVQTLYTYIIKGPNGVQIEHDRHITGLFPLSTWERLMREAGFTFEQRTYHLSDGIDYSMLIGRM